MRSFDLAPQIERLVAAGIGRIQRIEDDVYRKLWPATVEMPAKYDGRFDRVLCVDIFPLYPMRTAVDDRRGRRTTLPVRLLPLPGASKPTAVAFDRAEEAGLEPIDLPGKGQLLRYVIFWQAGERWTETSPNAAHARFAADECGLTPNEALHLPLQEEEYVRGRDIALAYGPDAYGMIPFLWWEAKEALPEFQARFGMFVLPHGIPSRAKEVIPVSTEYEDFYLKD